MEEVFNGKNIIIFVFINLLSKPVFKIFFKIPKNPIKIETFPRKMGKLWHLTNGKVRD